MTDSGEFALQLLSFVLRLGRSFCVPGFRPGLPFSIAKDRLVVSAAGDNAAAAACEGIIGRADSDPYR